MDSSAELDVVVHGAAGFTGQPVAEYLATRHTIQKFRVDKWSLCWVRPPRGAEKGRRFFEFRRQLDDKARLYGASVVVADRWFPSSKTCSCCGSVKAELDLSQRVFRCGPCGLVADRDCNACEKSCTTGRKLRGVSPWRGTLWRGSQEPRETRLKEPGTERRQSALRSLSLPSRRFRRAVKLRHQRLQRAVRPSVAR
jgi:Putative transposase DNA-binding domain